MRKYRLAELLRAAAATWMTAACTAPAPTPATADGGGTADSNTTVDSATTDTAAVDGTDSSDGEAPDGGSADATFADASGPDAASDAGTDGAAADTAQADGAADGTTVADSAANDNGGKDTAGTDSSGKPVPFPCLNPQPVIVQGIDTGVDSCAQGGFRRRLAVACPAYVADPAKTCPAPGGSGCSTDADCAGQGGGPCSAVPGAPFCSCTAVCQTDADCGTGQVCLCGASYGSCVMASCTTGADCDTGDCVTYETTPGCGGVGLACQTANDGCMGKGDCPNDKPICTIANPADGAHVCSPVLCAIGRPFEVDGAWRTAAAAQRTDWTTSTAMGQADGEVTLDASGRAAVAQFWLSSAHMEHASVASFARLTLELLAVGAPPHLVAASQQAGLDEVRHAQLGYGLASQFGGTAVGPGPLATSGSLQATSLASLAAATVREGCVWETIAALEAQVCAASARHASVAHALTAIAADEARHAELAWDIVRWALAQGDGDVAAAVDAAFDEALAAVSAQVAAGSIAADADVPAGWGALGPQEQARLRSHAVASVIEPARRRLRSGC